MSEPILELAGVSICYGGTQVVSDVNLSVADGEFVSLLGPSGSGKTSLLRAIAGFVTPSTGDVRLNGKRINGVPAFRRDIGMVFQSYALFPHMTVEQNLSFGPRMLGVPKEQIRRRVDEALDHVRLTGLKDRYPKDLSGGQQQRVAIARALAVRPALLLMDEPMSNLDERLRAQMRIDLIALLRHVGITTVCVTHNQQEALAMSDRIFVMVDGRIRQSGTPLDVYRRPADRCVADFVGDINVLKSARSRHEAGRVRFETTLGVHVIGVPADDHRDGPSLLLIRPEDVEIVLDACSGDGANEIDGVIAGCAYMGSHLEIHVTACAQAFVARVPATEAHRALRAQDAVRLRWRPESVICLFDAIAQVNA
ncbi:ABC transporter ATP-binding protein [Paraburkholderia sp. J41]|uniref:ABC transporter ATP-binding protein n=1 Tax=Paraburkholderia sp. J41 TaxID=2805433 RepID=UPI002AC31A36|nr:ABC transporter ATP-binding protein [Paraburkholderia sp. J41]